MLSNTASKIEQRKEKKMLAAKNVTKSPINEPFLLRTRLYSHTNSNRRTVNLAAKTLDRIGRYAEVRTLLSLVTQARLGLS